MRKLKTIDAHTEAVRTLGFVNDGALLLTGSSDRSILALDTATGKPLAKLEHAHKSAVNRLRVLDRNLVATGCDDGVVKVWDTPSKPRAGPSRPSSISSRTFATSRRTRTTPSPREPTDQTEASS